MPYWYAFRQIIPKPPGSWIATGPYENYAAAKRGYEHAKLTSDAQVSPPFSAENQKEADLIAQRYNNSN